jgi:hypothetical protein
LLDRKLGANCWCTWATSGRCVTKFVCMHRPLVSHGCLVYRPARAVHSDRYTILRVVRLRCIRQSLIISP